MFEWIGLTLRGVCYLGFVLFAQPFLVLFRIYDRPPHTDDGIGYDDDDPGKDVDE